MKKENIVEILDKHLKLMIKNAEENYYDFEEMKKLPEYKACLNAMLEVVEKVVNKNCNLQNVVFSEAEFCDCEKPTLGDNIWSCGNCKRPFKKVDKQN